MMHNALKLLLRLALPSTLILSLLPLSASYASLYKWTDEHGKVHYSDTPPPVNTRYGHEVLTKQALSVRKVDRELTRQERYEASRITDDMILTMKQEREQARIDRLLTVSFPNFETLNTARDDRLVTLVDSMAYLQSRKDGLLEKRQENSSRIQNFRRKKLDIPAQLSSEAAVLDSSMAQLDRQLADIQADHDATVAEFERYANRLHELQAMWKQPE